MKRKFDFVTNSSSTSFCCWGIEINFYLKDIPENLQRIIYNKYVEFQKNNQCLSSTLSFEDFISNNEIPDLYYSFDWTYILNEILNIYGLNWEADYNSDIMYIGIVPNCIPENKTIKEAKNEAKENLEKLGFDVKNFKYICEGWYN